MENKKDISKKYEIGEDATQYGEFITSYFAWIPLSVQKKKAEDLENITNSENERKKEKQLRKINKIKNFDKKQDKKQENNC